VPDRNGGGELAIFQANPPALPPIHIFEAFATSVVKSYTLLFDTFVLKFCVENKVNVARISLLPEASTDPV
jgi:hypothetical protein